MGSAQPAFDDLSTSSLGQGAGTAGTGAGDGVEVEPAAPGPMSPTQDDVDRLLERAIASYRIIWLGADRQTRDMAFGRIYHYKQTRPYEEAVRAALDLRTALLQARTLLAAEQTAVEALPVTPEAANRAAKLARQATLFDTLALWSSARVLHYDTPMPFDQRRDRTLDSDPSPALGFPGYYGTSWYSPSAWFGSRLRLSARQPSADAVSRSGAAIAVATAALDAAEQRKALLLAKRSSREDLDGSGWGGWILMQYADLKVFEDEAKPAALDLGLDLARAKAAMNEAAVLIDALAGRGTIVPHREAWTRLADRYGKLARWAAARNIYSSRWNRIRRDFRLVEDTGFVGRHVISTGGPASEILARALAKTD